MTQASARTTKTMTQQRAKRETSKSAPESHQSVVELAQALTALQKNTTELLERKRQLQQLNRWFDVALNNMGRGLSMFDDKQRMIVCNSIYREIYGIPQRLTRPGTPISKIMRYHVRQESGRDDPEELERQCKWLDEHVRKLKQGETFSYTQELNNGRIVQVTNQPLVGGGWVDIQEDITERRKAEQKIVWLAHHDPLTQTANRVFFGEELNNALRQLQSGSGFALHWIDLDHFKKVNDELGHPAGDTLLKHVAKRLHETVREHDLVARLGGDEFAVIQSGATEAEANELIKRLFAAIKGPHDVLGTMVEIGASIGVVLAPKDGSSAEELMKNVDVALYHAKAAGRGTFAFFEGSRTDQPKESTSVT